MDIPIIDRSNYLKGLFITAKLDGELNNQEKEILKEISDKLGFSRDFYEETVRNLMRNKYITEEKIKFSSKEIALSFIEDALTISIASGNLNEKEKHWLNQISEFNQIDSQELKNHFEKIELALHQKSKVSKLALMSII